MRTKWRIDLRIKFPLLLSVSNNYWTYRHISVNRSVTGHANPFSNSQDILWQIKTLLIPFHSLQTYGRLITAQINLHFGTRKRSMLLQALPPPLPPKENFYYINIQWCISQTQQNFMFIIVLRQHVSILIESSSGPSKNTNPYLAMFKMRCGIPQHILNIIK